MIETRRLVLREMKKDDAEAFLDIFSDPVAMQYFGGVIFDRARMDKWVQSNLEHQEKHGFSLLTVILKDDNEIIGDCGLETDEIDGELIVGIGFDFKRARLAGFRGNDVEFDVAAARVFVRGSGDRHRVRDPGPVGTDRGRSGIAGVEDILRLNDVG